MIEDGTALVVGLPWYRSGSGKVMETQIRYLRSRCAKTIFVAVPHSAQMFESAEVWQQFSKVSPEFGADKVIIATFNHRMSKGGPVGKWLGARKGLTALDWHMLPAAISPIPPELDRELMSGRVKTLLVNHVYAIKFGQQIKERLKDLGHSVSLTLITHDIQSHMLLDDGIRNPYTRKMDSVDHLLDVEIRALKQADVLVHVSTEDKKFFEGALPNKPHVLVLPTSEDLSGIKHPFPEGATRDLLFVGAQNIANHRALEWFFTRVSPWLGASPLSALIIGNIRSFVQSRDPLFYNRIKEYFVGSVAETLPYYLMCKCAVVPMVSGRGVSIKTVEASAVGRPIIGTSFAYRGLPKEAMKAAGVKICDDPREFALEIFSALDDPGPRAEASRRLFKQLFSYERFQTAMDEALAAARPPRG